MLLSKLETHPELKRLTSKSLSYAERLEKKSISTSINFLSYKQHEFRSGRGCPTQMLGHFDEMMLGFKNGVDADSIYLDYAKAFDTVGHNLPRLKLMKYGFSKKLVNWIQS